jgi:predicted RNA-binding Zn ribbon-like protein
MLLWLEFVNSDVATDALASFDGLVTWLERMALLDVERGDALRRRALLQPAGATAALQEARRVRSALRALAESGAGTPATNGIALAELNRVLGRSAGMRRVEQLRDGRFVHSFVAAGDAFAGLLLPLVESATDSLVNGQLDRVRRCAGARCARVFFDESRNGSRRWCDMATCGNRAKASRWRERRAS